jgi:UDP-N-acetylmuramoylalanine--D-glutamate ligase
VLTLDPPAPERTYVVECSSYQIDLTPSIRPTVGILLNLTPDHLDRHGTMENYAAIKARLLKDAGTAVIGVDDDFCAGIADWHESEGNVVLRISKEKTLESGVFFADGSILVAVGGTIARRYPLAGIGSLRGRHNGQNAAAAVATLEALGVAQDAILAGLASFPGLVHRMEEIGRQGSVLFVNDSKATNADAAAPALASFERIHWIAGGLPKEGGIDSLEPLFPRIAKAYLIGEAAPSFAATLGERIPYEISGSLQVAVENAAREAGTSGREEIVLLSPACASFDQFRNFEVRGDTFRQLVNALPGAAPIVRT